MSCWLLSSRFLALEDRRLEWMQTTYERRHTAGAGVAGGPHMKKIEFDAVKLCTRSLSRGAVIPLLGFSFVLGSPAFADDDGTHPIPSLQAITYSGLDQNPPVFSLIHAGNIPLIDPRGHEYFLEGELVLPIVSVVDPDRGQVPCELFLDGEPFLPGTSIETNGEHSLVAFAEDDNGGPCSATWRIDVRQSMELACSAFAQREYLPKIDQWAYYVEVSSEQFSPDAVEPRYLTLSIDYPENSGMPSHRFFIDGLYPDGSHDPSYEDGEFTLNDSVFLARFTVPNAEVEPEMIFLSGESRYQGLDFDIFETVEILDGGLADDLDISGIGMQPDGWTPPDPGGRPCHVQVIAFEDSELLRHIDQQMPPWSWSGSSCGSKHT